MAKSRQNINIKRNIKSHWHLFNLHDFQLLFPSLYSKSDSHEMLSNMIDVHGDYHNIYKQTIVTI